MEQIEVAPEFKINFSRIFSDLSFPFSLNKFIVECTSRKRKVESEILCGVILQLRGNEGLSKVTRFVSLSVQENW